MAEHLPKDPTEPAVRVVDRRWWARKEGDAPAETGEARKPSYIEDLERQLAEQGAQLQAYAAEHRRALEEFEQVKVRLRRDVARQITLLESVRTDLARLATLKHALSPRRPSAAGSTQAVASSAG